MFEWMTAFALEHLAAFFIKKNPLDESRFGLRWPKIIFITVT